MLTAFLFLVLTTSVFIMLTTILSIFTLLLYLVNKPLPDDGILEDILSVVDSFVWKINSWPRSEASKATVKFWGQSISQRHYILQYTSKPGRGLFILKSFAQTRYERNLCECSQAFKATNNIFLNCISWKQDFLYNFAASISKKVFLIFH